MVNNGFSRFCLPTVAIWALAAISPTAAMADGPYLGYRQGGNFMPDTDLSVTDAARRTSSSITLDSDIGFMNSAALGYAFQDFRGEIEPYYGLSDVSAMMGRTTESVDLQQYGAFANFYYDIPTGTDFKPYVGAGGGWAAVDRDILGEGLANGYGYQGMLGLGYAFSDHIIGELSYTHRRAVTDDFSVTDLTFDPDDLVNNVIAAGIRFHFNGDARGGGRRRSQVSGGAPAPESAARRTYRAPADGDPFGPSARTPTEAFARNPYGQPAYGQPAYGQQPAQTYAQQPHAQQPAYRQAQPYTGYGFPPRQSQAPLPGAPQPFQGAAPASPVTPRPAPADTGGSGGFAVQLASFRNPVNADAGWRDLQDSIGDLLGGRRYRLIEASLPGRGVWHRMYVAGMSRSEASRLCGRIKARGKFCAVSPLS